MIHEKDGNEEDGIQHLEREIVAVENVLAMGTEETDEKPSKEAFVKHEDNMRWRTQES